MLCIAQLAAVVSLITAIAAAPASNDKRIALPVRKRASGKAVSAKDVVEHDLARIANYNARWGGGPATNRDVSYVITVRIGGQTFDLIVDTGSSNIWAGANTPVKGGTSTGETFAITYGSGSVSGEERIGAVSYGGFTVSSQSFGAATNSSGFNGVDGIIGFGPVDLTEGTVSNSETVPTFMGNLRSTGAISEEVLGVFFKPLPGSAIADANGELTLGGVDLSKYTGSLTYFPKSTVFPYSQYWGIAVSRLTYGSTPLALLPCNAIVDTGTTLIYIPTIAYKIFLFAAGGKTDGDSGLARFSTKPAKNFAIKFGSSNFVLTPAQYLVPKAQYSNFGLQDKYYYAWINDGGPVSLTVNFIIGQKFLENYYSVYDTTNSRIGFAPAA